MKEFFARLNPVERRFVVGVIVVFFLVINMFWVWPHFADWSQTSARMDAARKQLGLFESGTNLIPGLKKEIAKYQGQGEIVPSQDQAVRFVRLIQNQTTQFGFVPESMTPGHQSSASTNSFFVEQLENLRMQTTEKQLVDFLYSLGAGTNSLIRVKAMSVSPDPSHQKLSSGVTLVASYQKKPVAADAAGGRKRPPSAPAAPPIGGTPPSPTPAASKPAGGTPPSQAPAVQKPVGGQPPLIPPAPKPGGLTNHPIPSIPGQTGAMKTLTPTKK